MIARRAALQRPRKSMSFFFFNDTATTEIYTLSLHDALPICEPAASRGARLALVGPIPPRLDIPVPERVERLLAGPGPIVYVAMPSSEPGLVRAAVGALRPLGARI